MEETEESNARRLQNRRNLFRQTTTLRSAPYNSSLSSVRRRRENSLIHSQAINNLIPTGNFTSEENEIIDDQDDFQVLLDLSNANHSEENEPLVSNIDVDPEDEHQYYYSHSSSTAEENPIQYPYDDDDDLEEYPPSINNNHQDDGDDDEEDLSIEIILESSQNNSIPRRRRSMIPYHNHGLRLADILSIPQKLFGSLKSSINDKTQCYICLEDFQSIDSIKILHCQHIFHTACINEWLRTHSNCAYCRTAVVVGMFHTTTATARHRHRTHSRRSLLRNSIVEQSQP